MIFLFSVEIHMHRRNIVKSHRYASMLIFFYLNFASNRITVSTISSWRKSSQLSGNIWTRTLFWRAISFRRRYLNAVRARKLSFQRHLIFRVADWWPLVAYVRFPRRIEGANTWFLYRRSRISCMPAGSSGDCSVVSSCHRKRLVSIYLSYVRMKSSKQHLFLFGVVVSRDCASILARTSLATGAAFVTCLSWWWTEFLRNLRYKWKFLTCQNY